MKSFLFLVAFISTTLSSLTHASEDIFAEIPGTIVKVHVQPNQWVMRGTTLFTMEMMKMQIDIKAPRDGYIHELYAEPRKTIGAGYLLLRLGEQAAKISDNKVGATEDLRQNRPIANEDTLIIDASINNQDHANPTDIHDQANPYQSKEKNYSAADALPIDIYLDKYLTYTTLLEFDDDMDEYGENDEDDGSEETPIFATKIDKSDHQPPSGPNEHTFFENQSHLVEKQNYLANKIDEVSLVKHPFLYRNITMQDFSRVAYTYVPIVTHQLLKGILTWFLISMSLQYLISRLGVISFIPNHKRQTYAS